MRLQNHLPVNRVTHGPDHHFFGYYDKHQFDPSGRYLLSLETTFMDRSPKASDTAGVCVIDLQRDNAQRCIASTNAWCWQQGAMLQWVPSSAANRCGPIAYNTRIGDRFVARLYDFETGAERTLPRPIYTISNNGAVALSLNFARNAVTRPGYGYNGLADHWSDELHPNEDGIYLMDLATGNHQLVVSIDQVANFAPEASMSGAKHWVNHLLFAPEDHRFIFLHRWKPVDGTRAFKTRVFTVNADGSKLHLTNLDDGSHFIWYDKDTLLIWASTPQDGPAYYLYKDFSEEPQVFGKGVLTRNGHCTVSPDRRWVLTDEYPDSQGNRPLILYSVEDQKGIDIGSFYSPPELSGELRCDLHPRWNRDGSLICVDSAHEGSRQMYVIDVSSLTR